MVQIYNSNLVGKQFSIDVKNIAGDKLKPVELMRPFMDKVVKQLVHINLKNIIPPLVLT